ncbi:MAG TPA: hypothetical protein VEA69_26110 [Tepidisphaeraceae bacterium]|nr:hypothetical protein [Tepidisphaeraceae bacterium]
MRILIASLTIAVACVISYADEKLTPAPKPSTTTTAAATKPKPPADPTAWITDKDIDKIDFDELPDDSGLVTPLAKDLDNLEDEARKRLTDWATKLNDWAGTTEANVPQRVRNLMAVCALSDIVHAEFEGELAYVVFEKCKSEVDKDQLIKAAAWIVLKPREGKAPLKIPDLGWEDELDEDMIRERSMLYAQKLLGRLMGKLPKKE